MKMFLSKMIATKKAIPELELGIDHLNRSQILTFRDILINISLLEDPMKSAEMGWEEMLPDRDETFKDRFLRTIGTLDCERIREDLECFCNQPEFIELIRKSIANNILGGNNEAKNRLRALFYQIFDRRLGVFREMAEASLGPNVTRKGILLLSLKNLEIEVFEEVQKEDELTSDELQIIYDAICNISYTHQAYLTLIKELVIRAPQRAVHNPFELDQQRLIIYTSARGALQNTIYSAFGHAIHRSNFFFPWHISKRFSLLSWFSRRFSLVLGELSFSHQLAQEREDFASIFEAWRVDRDRLQARAKKFRAFLLRWKLKLLLPILK